MTATTDADLCYAHARKAGELSTFRADHNISILIIHALCGKPINLNKEGVFTLGNDLGGRQM